MIWPFQVQLFTLTSLLAFLTEKLSVIPQAEPAFEHRSWVMVIAPVPGMKRVVLEDDDSLSFTEGFRRVPPVRVMTNVF